MTQLTTETVRELLHEEMLALQHADRDWNPLRTVPTGGRSVNMQSNTLTPGMSICVASARDTRSNILIVAYDTGMSVTMGGYYAASGACFPLIANVPVTLWTKAEIWLSLSPSAGKSVAYGIVESYD